MALIEYKCTRCEKTQHVFSGEEKTRLISGGSCPRFTRQCHNYKAMPPNPIIIHATDTWMSEPALDSFQSTYELDRILNIEAAHAKEMTIINDVRKKL